LGMELTGGWSWLNDLVISSEVLSFQGGAGKQNQVERGAGRGRGRVVKFRSMARFVAWHKEMPVSCVSVGA
jgi:hypothetical protein